MIEGEVAGLCEHGINPNDPLSPDFFCEVEGCKNNMECHICGAWILRTDQERNVEVHVKHECDPSVPVSLSFVISEQADRSVTQPEQEKQIVKEELPDTVEETVRDSKNKLFEIMDMEPRGQFDSGVGFGMRDWQFEMLSVEERKELVESAKQIAEEAGVRLILYFGKSTEHYIPKKMRWK